MKRRLLDIFKVLPFSILAAIIVCIPLCSVLTWFRNTNLGHYIFHSIDKVSTESKSAIKYAFTPYKDSTDPKPVSAAEPAYRSTLFYKQLKAEYINQYKQMILQSAEESLKQYDFSKLTMAQQSALRKQAIEDAIMKERRKVKQ